MLVRNRETGYAITLNAISDFTRVFLFPFSVISSAAYIHILIKYINNLSLMWRLCASQAPLSSEYRDAIYFINLDVIYLNKSIF